MRRWIFAIIPLAALAGLIGWRIHNKQAEAAGQAQMRQQRSKSAAAVSVAPVVVRDIVHTFEGVGSVEAPLNVKISAKVTGRIDYLQAHEGDRVTLGQVLVRLDPSELQAQIQQQQANVAQARQRLAEAVFTRNPTSVSVATGIEQQQAAVNSARADYNQTAQNYSSQVAAAQSAVTDAQGRVDVANAAVANAQAAIRSARANLANATSRYDRTNNLYKQGFIAAQDVDDARTTVNVQQGALEVAEGQLGQAQAQLASAQAQKRSAQQQADIVATKGKADIEASRAKLLQSQAALRSAQANRAQVPAYQENLAALKSAVSAAEASVRNAQAQLANTVLKSPLTGHVTARYMDPGAMATPGQPILGVQAIRQVWVSVPIPEEVSRKVFEGQAARVAFDALPDMAFNGKISQLNPSADPASRQFTARVTLDNARNLIKPGMFGRVTLVVDRIRGAMVVPREAIRRGKGEPTVAIVGPDSVAHVVPVTTGASDADGIAITQGVQPGDKVVTMSAMPVRDGQKVRMGGAGPPGGRGGSRQRGNAAPPSAGGM